ncbi:MAG: RHS repeat protein [Lysobacter sp.]|nr:MAG: RHS repeat protein [Lysobacter sp.]
MRWMTRSQGGWGSVVALRALAAAVVGLAVARSPDAWAQNTQPQAAQDCESQMPDKYAEVAQSYPPGQVNGWRCVVDNAANPTQVRGQVYLDMYGTNSFNWYGVPVYSSFSYAALDANKQCGFACGTGQATTLGTKAGNPIDLATGNKYKAESDLDGDLPFQRYYLGDDVARPVGMFGGRWRSVYDRRIVTISGSGTMSVIAYRAGGQGLYFNSTGSAVYTSDKDTPYKLEKLFSGSTHTGWRLTDANDAVELYDVDGKPTSTTWPSGEFQTLAYDANARLQTVTGRDGRKLSFAYDSSGRLQTLTDASGAVTTYAYDPSSGLLGTVTYPGGATRKYFYNEAGRVVSPPPGTYYLTGIEDENGQRHASYSYDSANRAILSTLAGDAERVDVSYGTGTSATVTDALGRTTTRNWTVAQRVAKYTGASGLSVSQDSALGTATYDANGYVNVETDFLGNQTDYDYNTRGLETQRIEAKTDTTGKKRTLQTDWHATYRVPIERRVRDSAGTLKAKVAWTYNTREQPLTQTATDPTVTPNTTRTTTYTYCESADVTAGTCPFVGLLKSVNGPRSDVSDLTTFTYRQADHAACATAPTTCAYRKGDLWKVTNALGHIVEVQAFDGAGRPLSIVDANNVRTDYEYHARGWLTASKVRGTNDTVETDDRIVRVEYWPTGLVKKVTQPDGAFITFAYDAAHRLTGIADSAGNTVTYTLNKAGERTQEDVKDATNTLRRTLSRTYNTLGQLTAVTDAYNRSTGFTYDANGNLDQVTDALLRVTDQNVDPLNRLSRSLQDMAGLAAQTQVAYDALDNPTQVTDPKGLNTTYAYTGFSELKTLTSPDTGTTTYTYDAAGNRASQVDARSKTTNYGYDALNRPISVTYPTATALNVAYVYDTAQADCQTGETFTIGRLAKMTDGSGSTVYCYDRFGALVRKVQTTNGQSFTLRYVYAANGQLQKTIYPDNAEASYLYDAQGRTQEINVKTATGTTIQLLRSASYHPFGPVQQWTYGNGRVMTRTLNLNGEPGIVQVNATDGLSLGYEFDEVGNLKKLRNGNQSDPPLRVFGYDALNRLIETKDGGTNAVLQSYAYDATGNRTSATVSGVTTTNTYETASHRMIQVGVWDRTYDNAGNTTYIAAPTTGKTFVYGDHNRLTQVLNGATVAMNYVYNGMGERVRKHLNTANTYTLYDEAGRWLGDYGNTGAPNQQVIWFDDLPVGVLDGAGANQKLHYIEPDALGTPRVVIDRTRGAQGVAIWTWNLTGEAFGTTLPNENPDGDATTFVFDMRFPGQRYDSASGLNYNYFRDYEPGTGRYSQSDPIGLTGGVSTYGYAGGMPTGAIDPMGLAYGYFDWGDVVFMNAGQVGDLLGFDAALPQGYVDFVFGALDGASFGASALTRRLTGAQDAVNECSGYYTAGGWAAVAYDLLSGGGLIKSGLRATKGLGWKNPLYKNAVEQFKKSDLSNAGRALSKHPEVIGETKNTIRQTLRSDRAMNGAAHSALRNIMRNGVITNPVLGRYGKVTQIQIPGGFGARWAADGSFIGFINP